MTVETLDFTQTHGGDGVTVAFPFDRPFADTGDLKATIINAVGVRRTPTFTVSAGGSGATVTITSEVPAAGETVLLERATTLLQKTNYSAGKFPSKTHEDMADRLTMAAQERRASEARALRVGPDEAELPPMDVLEVNHVLVRTTTGFGQGPTADEVGNAQGYAAAASASADSAAASAGSASGAASAAASAQGDVASKHGEVQSWHSAVQTWHQSVDGWRQTVASQHGEVQTWRGEVQTWHGDVATALTALVGSVGDTPPQTPEPDSFWLKTSDPFGLYFYYDDGDSQQWVQVAGIASGNAAYQVAVANGFAGTEAEWLASLVGPQGDPGPAGADGTNVTITVAASQAAYDAATPGPTELVVLYA